MTLDTANALEWRLPGWPPFFVFERPSNRKLKALNKPSNLLLHAINISNKSIVLAGCAIWVLSFLGEINGYQPFSSAGIILAYILVFVGAFLWLRAYKSLNGHYPRSRQVMNMTGVSTFNPFVMLKEGFKNLPRTFAVVMVFTMLIILVVQIMFRQSGALDAAKLRCETDEAILARTGPIKYYSLLVAGNIQIKNYEGEGDLHFTIIGSKGNFKARALLTMNNDEWTVDEIDVTNE